jgi:hypothetical protein
MCCILEILIHSYKYDLVKHLMNKDRKQRLLLIQVTVGLESGIYTVIHTVIL